MPIRKRRRVVKRKRRMKYNPEWWKTITGYANKFGYSGLSSAGSAAYAALRGVQYLKGLVNSEMYKVDITDTGTIITDAGTYQKQLTAVAQGDGDSARTGNSIYVRSLNIRGQIIFNSSGTNPQFLRLMVVIDRQQIADSAVSTTTVLAGGYNSHLNSLNVGRFTILHSRTYALDDNDRLVTNFVINLPMRLHVRYNGTANTDIQRNGIWIVAVSSEPTNGPKLVFDSRLSYHDN